MDDTKQAGSATPAEPLPRRRDLIETAERVRLERLGFGEVLAALRRGEKVARAGWNGRGQYVAMVFNGHALGRQMPPFLVIVTTTGDVVPWVASQSDLIISDWMIVREESVLVYGNGRDTIAAAFARDMGAGQTEVRPDRPRSTTGDHAG